MFAPNTNKQLAFDDSCGSVITDYRYEQNVQSDSQFLKDSIENAAGP